MEYRHKRDPQRVRISFNSLSPRVPDKTKTIGQVPGIPHRDHCIIEKNEISLSIDNEASFVDVDSCIDGKKQQDYDENEIAFGNCFHVC